MNGFRFAAGVLLSSALLMSGCVSKVTQPDQYSGFLADYSKLQPAKSPTGQPVMRWTAPGLSLNNYQHLVVQSVKFYPEPTPTEQVGTQALVALQDYLSTQVKGAFGKRFQVHELNSAPQAPLPGGQTLILRAAITGVSNRTEPLKPYEVIPIALVAAAAMTASGHRDELTELFVEAELLDAGTGKPVLQVVRKGFGKDLENDQQQVTLDTLKGVVDGMVHDIELFE